MKKNKKTATRQTEYFRRQKINGIPLKRDVADAIFMAVGSLRFVKPKPGKPDPTVNLTTMKRWLVQSAVNILVSKGNDPIQCYKAVREKLGVSIDHPDVKIAMGTRVGSSKPVPKPVIEPQETEVTLEYLKRKTETFAP